MIRDILTKVYLVLAGIGIVDAIYHSYDELTEYSGPGTNACSTLGSTFNCQSVFAYSHPFGIPLYVFGLVWFPLALIIGFIAVNKAQNVIRLNAMILLPFIMIGNIFTVYLWYLDLAIVYPAVHAFCPVCISLYVINYAMTAVVALSARTVSDRYKLVGLESKKPTKE